MSTNLIILVPSTI